MEVEPVKEKYIIRPVEPDDNEALREIIVTSLLEFGATGDGFACNDLETSAMFEAYQERGRKYYVLVNAQNLNVVGGAGVAPLKGSTEICEFVKMY
ncbi:MAG: hypothetical protein J7L96_10845 [Bacteroidales bacterium]|nr:hypothetical protein [Bacteroidales bacterium]